MLNYLNEMKVLYEKYYGKNPKIENIEKQIGKLMNKYKNNKNINLNKMPETRIIETQLKEIFNFYSSRFEWTNKCIGAATEVIILNKESLTGKRNLYKKTSNGLVFKNEAKVVLVTYMDVNLFLVRNMTPAEMTAILLHEIGHQFQYSTTTDSIYLKIQAIEHLVKAVMKNPYGGLLEIIIDNPEFRKSEIDNTVERLMKDKRNQSLFDKIHNWISDVKFHGLFGYKKSTVLKTLRDFATLPLVIMSSPFAVVRNTIDVTGMTIGFKHEKFADSFAGAHGYNSELASALKKLEYEPDNWFEKRLEISETLSLLNNIVMLPVTHIVHIGACHPRNLTRVKDRVTQLEKELHSNNELTKEEKEVIGEDLIKTKAVLDDMIGESKEYDFEAIDPNLLEKVWNRALYKLFKTGNFRDLFYNKSGKDFEQLK